MIIFFLITPSWKCNTTVILFTFFFVLWPFGASQIIVMSKIFLIPSKTKLCPLKRVSPPWARHCTRHWGIEWRTKEMKSLPLWYSSESILLGQGGKKRILWKSDTWKLRSEGWVVLSSKEPNEKHSRKKDQHIPSFCGRREYGKSKRLKTTNMDRAIRVSENTVYNEAGEGRKETTVHRKDFSLYSKSQVKKMND